MEPCTQSVLPKCMLTRQCQLPRISSFKVTPTQSSQCERQRCHGADQIAAKPGTSQLFQDSCSFLQLQSQDTSPQLTHQGGLCLLPGIHSFSSRCHTSAEIGYYFCLSRFLGLPWILLFPELIIQWNFCFKFLITYKFLIYSPKNTGKLVRRGFCYFQPQIAGVTS